MPAPNNPKGAKSDKEWRDAIRMAVYELRVSGDNPEKVKALRLLARALVEKALKGDIPALKEIGDRLDGRPSQAVVLGEDPDKPLGGGRERTILETARAVGFLMSLEEQAKEKGSSGG